MNLGNGNTAREHVRRAIQQIVHDNHGPEGFTEHPAFSGASTTEPTPDPVSAFTAARVVAHEANMKVRRAVGDLRADGHTWSSVADILDGGTGTATAEDAFERFADPGLSGVDQPRLAWRCASCGRSVSDTGPYNGHPADCETGHSPDCARHVLDIERYEAWRDES